MQAITVVGLDIAKSVFQVHGVNAHGSVVIRRQLKRRYVVAFFKKLPPCLIGIEACATPHHWSRFKTLMELGNKAPALCLWCFDLLHLNGVRITPLALAERKAQLADLVAIVGDKHLQFSGDFSDPLALLQTCRKMNLEGIVSKRRKSAYRSGPTRDWLKIKTASWRAANRERWELFDNRN